MAAEIITKEDLQEFSDKLLSDIKALLGREGEDPPKWLKSYQVKNMLKISPGTLQNLRLKGTLPFTKVGGILYYRHSDIMNLLQDNLRSQG